MPHLDPSKTIIHPMITFVDPVMPKGIKDETTHNALLDYLLSRALKGRTLRDTRIQRFARIDKAVATWQKLSEDDQKRDEKEDSTGIPQAITTVIPILHTHLEDMTSFYSGVFSPGGNNFYALPTPEATEPLSALVKKMNEDAKYCGFFFSLASMIRSILKYNMAGFSIEWKETVEAGTTKLAGNHMASIDMYNTFWDPSVKNPAKVAKDAEWLAEVCIKNRFWLVSEGRKGGWWRLNKVIEEDDSETLGPLNRKTAQFYKFPPQDAKMSLDGNASESSIDSYFQGLDAGTQHEIVGHEVMSIYCRLNPTEWNLVDEETAAADQEEFENPTPEYELWRFIVVDSSQIVYAERVKTLTNEIPYYMGHLNVDEMGEASKSTAELLKTFQGFISFLFNIHVAGARGAVWGITAINPKFYDSAEFRKGDVAVVLKMKEEVAASFVNPSQGIARIQNSASDTRTTMVDVNSVLQLLQLLFPSQNLPSQIASIDRAVESQVAAVLQGVNRRQHMLANVLDAQIMHPLRMAAYYNIGYRGDETVRSQLNGLTYGSVTTALGSGLKQLNREVAAKAMERILFAMIQSPDTIEKNGIDIMGMMDYWADLMELDIDLSQFQKAVQPAGQPSGQPVSAEGVPAITQQESP